MRKRSGDAVRWTITRSGVIGNAKMLGWTYGDEETTEFEATQSRDRKEILCTSMILRFLPWTVIRMV